MCFKAWVWLTLTTGIRNKAGFSEGMLKRSSNSLHALSQANSFNLIYWERSQTGIKFLTHESGWCLNKNDHWCTDPEQIKRNAPRLSWVSRQSISWKGETWNNLYIGWCLHDNKSLCNHWLKSKVYVGLWSKEVIFPSIGKTPFKGDWWKYMKEDSVVIQFLEGI